MIGRSHNRNFSDISVKSVGEAAIVTAFSEPARFYNATQEKGSKASLVITRNNSASSSKVDLTAPVKDKSAAPSPLANVSTDALESESQAAPGAPKKLSRNKLFAAKYGRARDASAAMLKGFFAPVRTESQKKHKQRVARSASDQCKAFNVEVTADNVGAIAKLVEAPGSARERARTGNDQLQTATRGAVLELKKQSMSEKLYADLMEARAISLTFE